MEQEKRERGGRERGKKRKERERVEEYKRRERRCMRREVRDRQGMHEGQWVSDRNNFRL